MLVLALDTSTPAITAGVLDLLLPNELMQAQEADPGAPVEVVRVLADDAVEDAFGHAEKLMPLITAVLQRADRTLPDLAAVVVGLGPGPFTGLRVGIATAAALGDGLRVPVHGVPSHDAVARSVGPTSDLVVITDARRREVYVSRYDATGARVGGPDVLAPAAVDEELAASGAAPVGVGPVMVAGAGVELVPGARALPRAVPGSLARGLVLVAGRALVTGAVPGPLTPLYLRRPDAQEPAAPRSTLTGPPSSGSTPTVPAR